MTKNVVAKAWTYRLWSDGTHRPYDEPTVAPGDAPSLTLSVVAQSITAAIAAVPPTGRSVVAYELQRSLDGSTGWVSMPTPDPVSASEIPAQNTATPTKYVHPSGTLAGNGAYTTIQAAFDAAVPGDVIVIGNATYSERPTLTRSGTSTQRIYIRCYDYNNRPTIDGNYTLPAGWDGSTGSACLLGIQAEYVTIDGINLTRSNKFGILVGDCTNNGFFVSAPNTFYRGVKLIRVSVIGANNNALRTINTDGCEVYGSTFLDAERSAYQISGFLSGWGAGVTLMGKNVTFIENSVGQVSGEGLHLGYHGAFGGGNGYAHIEATNVVIRNNRFFDTWSGPLYVTNVDGGVIERNVIWHTNDTRYWYGAGSGYPAYGLDIASESGNSGVAGFNGFIGARNLIIRNNVVSNALHPFRIIDEPAQQTNNVKILNNTFYRTVPGSAASVASVISSAEPQVTDLTFKNNLVYDATPAQMCRNWVTPGGAWLRGTNLWSTAPPSNLSGSGDVVTVSSGLVDATYQPTGTYPSVSSFDVTKAKIVAGSGGVNVGELLADVTTDLFGNARPTESGFFDIGAHSVSKPLATSYTESGLAATTTYYVRARYVDSAGITSAWSTTRTAVTG